MNEIAAKLSGQGFIVCEKSGPDEEHFGNWFLVCTRCNVAVRITSDRGHVDLDLVPEALYKAGGGESDWYNWDVVARALSIPAEIDPLGSLPEYLQELDAAFAPGSWERTRDRLLLVEEEKRLERGIPM